VSGRQRDVSQRRQVLKQVMKLEHETDLAPEAFQKHCTWTDSALQPDSLNVDRAAIEAFEPGDHPKNGRLAGS
jgi:hypothetical protein